MGSRELHEVGKYKSAGKHRDGSPRAVGDPKWGWVNVTKSVSFPPSVRWIIPVLDPLSVQKSGLRTVVALKADLARVAESLSPTFKPLGCSYLTFPVALGTNESPVAIDIETVGESISRIGVSDGRCTWTAPWDWRSAARVSEILGSGRRIVGHNLAFDLRYLKRELQSQLGTLVLSTIFDTMVAAHLLQPDLYKGLARAGSLYLDLQSWKHKSEDAPEEYNAKDVFYTWKLAEAEEVHLQETGQAKLFHETLMPALPVLIRMTDRGIRVDRERLAVWQKELGDKQIHLLESWNGLAPGINPLSPPQVARWLYKDHGFPVQRSKHGKTSVDESALKTILGRAPEGVVRDGIHTLLAFKKVAKLRGTYSEVEISADGCVHPHYLPAGKESDSGAAATGRLASSNPNIQNQPDEARRLFVPHISGEVRLLHGDDVQILLECDYSQIELRIAAYLANDAQLIEALKGDVHAATQARIGCDRVRAKNVLYGSLYGAGPRKLAILLRNRGVTTTEAECRALQLALAEAYPRLWAWRTEVVATGAYERYLTNPFGRRRYFYGGESAAPQMIDYLPQSTAADIVWDRLVPLDSFCTAHGGAILATVHDSFLMEFPKEAVNQCLVGGLREVLESEFPQIGPGFRVPVDMKIGSNWGQMEKLDPALVAST